MNKIDPVRGAPPIRRVVPVVTMLSVLLSWHTASAEMSLQEVLQAFEYSQVRLGSFQCDYTAKTVQRHIVIPETVGPAKDFSVARLQELPSQDEGRYTRIITARWAMQGPKWCVEYRTQEPPAFNRTDFSGKISFDGELHRSWTSHNNLGIIRGVTTQAAPQDLIIPANFQGDEDRRAVLHLGSTSLAGLETIGDAECYRLEYDPGRNAFAFTLWLDPKRGFNIVKMLERRSGGPASRLYEVTAFKQTAKGLWIPIQGKVTDYWQLGPDAGKVAAQTDFAMDAQSIVVNEPIADNVFSFQFADGTRVWDQIIEKQYVQGESLLQEQLDYMVHRTLEMSPELNRGIAPAALAEAAGQVGAASSGKPSGGSGPAPISPPSGVVLTPLRLAVLGAAVAALIVAVTLGCIFGRMERHE